MKRFRLIPGLFLVCSLVVVLFSSAPVQAENSDPSSCFVSSVVAFFDPVPEVSEASLLLPVISSEAGLTMAETVKFSVSTSVDAEQEGPWARFLKWLCRLIVRISTVDNDEDRVAGEFACDQMD